MQAGSSAQRQAGGTAVQSQERLSWAMKRLSRRGLGGLWAAFPWGHRALENEHLLVQVKGATFGLPCFRALSFEVPQTNDHQILDAPSPIADRAPSHVWGVE